MSPCSEGLIHLTLESLCNPRPRRWGAPYPREVWTDHPVWGLGFGGLRPQNGSWALTAVGRAVSPASGAELTVGLTGAGANLSGVAMDGFYGRSGWEALFLDEWEVAANSLLRACWGDRWPSDRFHGAAHYEDPCHPRPECAFWLLTLRCQPWSYANVNGHLDWASAVQEIELVYRYLARCTPLVICHEVPLAHLDAPLAHPDRSEAWARAERVISRASGGRYVWVRLLTDPSRQRPFGLLGRGRALYVGVLASAMEKLVGMAERPWDKWTTEGRALRDELVSSWGRWTLRGRGCNGFGEYPVDCVEGGVVADSRNRWGAWRVV